MARVTSIHVNSSGRITLYLEGGNPLEDYYPAYHNVSQAQAEKLLAEKGKIHGCTIEGLNYRDPREPMPSDHKTAKRLAKKWHVHLKDKVSGVGGYSYKSHSSVGGGKRRRAGSVKKPIPAAACQRCGGWTGYGGMSQHSLSSKLVQGRRGCTCALRKMFPESEGQRGGGKDRHPRFKGNTGRVSRDRMGRPRFAGNLGLDLETKRILRAFQASPYAMPDLTYDCFYKGRRWWIVCLDTDAMWSVVKAVPGYDGFDFKTVTGGGKRRHEGPKRPSVGKQVAELNKLLK